MGGQKAILTALGPLKSAPEPADEATPEGTSWAGYVR